MKNLILNFPEHIKNAEKIYKANTKNFTQKNIQNVLITGLGGSGIGGSIVSELVEKQCPVPVIINKNYQIPAFINEKTLVIACSYSGNTEETLFATQQAIEKNAEIVILTSGGKILELAKQHNFLYFEVPGGNPPRSMLGYNLILLLYIFKHFNLYESDIQKNIQNFLNNLNQDEIIGQSKELALKIYNTFPILYAADGNEGCLVRLRQQLNENSKMLCWHGVVPEMNHNELVGWANGKNTNSVIYFRSNLDYIRNQKRIEINQKIIKKYTQNIFEIWAKGDSKLEQTLYFIHFGDWLSYHLSELNKVDIMEIDTINFLKDELSKFHSF